MHTIPVVDNFLVAKEPIPRMTRENVPSAQTRMLKVQNSFGIVKTVLENLF